MESIRCSPYRKPINRIMLSVFGALLLSCIVSPASAARLAEVSIGPAGIVVTAAVPEVSFLMLRIVDPNGEMIFDQSSEGGPLQWSPSAASFDGIYSYEVRGGSATRKIKRDETQRTKSKTRPWVSSGSVLIQNGNIAPPVEEENTSLLRGTSAIWQRAFATVMDFLVPAAYADYVHNDDVIIYNSACVGFDCVNPESFGSDSIRLKENNTRINFTDTSNSPFPTNDWTIEANSSLSGGLSYFAVRDIDHGRMPFTIEAGAPANALYLDDYGNIGLGTSTPAREIHVLDNDSPTLRLDQDGSGGWAPQVWDILGNETNFYIGDVTHGSTLPFRIQPGTPSNTLTLKPGGKVGIGSWSPAATLEIETTGSDTELMLDRTDGAKALLATTADGVKFGSTTDHSLTFVANNATVMTIDTSGNVVAAGDMELGSSREIKQDIAPVETAEAFSALRELRPVKFRYKRHPSEEVLGFVAEEVPDLVATESRKTMSPMDVVAVLTRVVQEQQKTIEEMSRRLAELENEVKTERGTPADGGKI